MTELENWMFLSLWTLLNTYFSPWSLPNRSEAQTFSPVNANMVLNFLKSECHILVWKALTPFLSQLLTTNSTTLLTLYIHFPDIPEHSWNFYLYLLTTLLHNLITFELLFISLNHSVEHSRVFHRRRFQKLNYLQFICSP